MKAKLFNNHPNQKKLTEKVRYQVLGIRKDLNNRNRFIIPVNKNVPCTDQIVVDVDGNLEPFYIGYLIGETADGEAKFGQIDFMVGNGGEIVLDPEKPQHHKMYDYMERCNYNQSNPNRTPGEVAIFKRVSLEADAAVRTKARRSIAKAVSAAEDLTDDEVKNIAIVIESIGRDKVVAHTIEVIRDLVEEWATKNADKFLSMINDQYLELESTLRTAVSLGILEHNKAEGIFSMDGKPVGTYVPKVGLKIYKALAETLTNSDPETLEIIKERIKLKS